MAYLCQKYSGVNLLVNSAFKLKNYYPKRNKAPEGALFIMLIC